MYRLILGLMAVLVCAPAMAQTFPSPTFLNLTVNGTAALNNGSIAGTFTGGTLSGTTFTGGTLGGSITGTGATITGGTFSGITFSGTQAGTLTLSGTLNAQGGTATFGTNTVAATNTLNGPAGSSKLLRFQTAGVNQWQIFSGTADQLQIQPFSAGVNLGNLVTLTNAGAITLNPSLVAAFNAAAFTSNMNNNNFAKGTVQLPTNLVSTAGTGFGPGGASPAILYGNTNLSGTNDTGVGTPYFLQVNDTLVSTNGGMSLVNIEDFYNAGADGPRGIMVLDLEIKAGSLSGNQNTTVQNIFGRFKAWEGGTALTAKGTLIGLNPDVSCQSPCDYLNRLTGTEEDVRLYAGTHALTKVIHNFHFAEFDAGHGSLDDAAITIDAAPTVLSGTGGGTVGIAFGSSAQQFPLDPTLTTSALMQIEPNVLKNLQGAWKPYAGFGIDLRYLNATTFAFASPGFSVDGGGQLNLGPATLTYSANTATLDAPNVAEVSAVVAAGGASGYQVGDELRDTIGGLWTVATISGSGGTASVATVTLLHAGYAAACPGAGAATTGGAGGSNATLTITCSVATKGLKLAGASTALGFYGATPIVKATPAGACAGNTGCQALRDALGNLGLINTGSITN